MARTPVCCGLALLLTVAGAGIDQHRCCAATRQQPEAPPSSAAELTKEEIQRLIDEYCKENERTKFDQVLQRHGLSSMRYEFDMMFKPTRQEGINLITPTNSFSMHLGGWFQWDAVGAVSSRRH
jgi:hypothetical protein